MFNQLTNLGKEHRWKYLVTGNRGLQYLDTMTLSVKDTQCRECEENIPAYTEYMTRDYTLRGDNDDMVCAQCALGFGWIEMA